MDIVTIMGSCAGILTTSSFLPQFMKTLKTKKTKDLSVGMYSVLSAGMFLWLVYGILIGSIPVILANGVSFVLAVTILLLKFKYG